MRRIASCSSLLAIAMLGSGQAAAQCAPSPAQTGQPVTCSGATTGGYTIATDQSPLTVTAGSSIQNTGDALTVAIPAAGLFNARTAAIIIAGSVASASGNGILFTSGPPDNVGDYDPFGTSGTITIAVGGSVSGAVGITAAQNTAYQSYSALAEVSLDNAGTITGTSGTALATVDSGQAARAMFYAVTNEATGTIGAITGSVNFLTNHGTIAGGAQSAIAGGAGFASEQISNDGTIQAAGSAATITATTAVITNSGNITNIGSGAAIANAPSITNLAAGSITAAGTDVVTGTAVSLSNYGTIVNTGTGQAVSGGTLTVTNYTGGTITAGSGGTAINASGGLTLVNGGTINGDILAGSASSGAAVSYVDSTLGTINGNLTFGNGQNTLVATVLNGAIQTGVTGTITGGAGTNSIQVTTLGDITLSSSVALPTNFNQLLLAPAYGTTLTLASGFGNPGTIQFIGSGTLANATNLTGTGQIVSASSPNFYSYGGTFTNSGSVTSANINQAAAIGLTGSTALTNSGSITASGDAVVTQGSVNNSGTITAGGTAVDISGYYLNATNSGTITSTGGTAVELGQGCTYCSLANSGTIAGATIAVDLGNGILTNRGSINSAGTGIAVGDGGTIQNLAGGIISGTAMAVGNANGSSSQVSVSNAGTIDGNVTLISNPSVPGYNSFDAAPGGMLNGNLTLGAGDALITDLINGGSGAYAGINGTVAANKSQLVYNVGANATITGTSPAGFASVAYQLYNSPTITFDSASTLTATLGLAGIGTAVLNGTVNTTDAVAVQSLGVRPATGYFIYGTSLAITNNGTITALRSNPALSVTAAVALGTSDTFVNNGTITMTDSSGNAPVGEAAMAGGTSLTNNGTITGIGVSAVSLLTFSSGITPLLINTGTLTSDQTTVIAANNQTITNSGTISSTGAAAIGDYLPANSYGYFPPAQVINLASGIISGTGDAIVVQGGTVANAGTINGNVNLAYSPNGTNSYLGDYVDNGGVLNGNLTLGVSDALVIDLDKAGSGPLGGVNGTINANGATLLYTVAADATTTATTPPAGFGAQAYVLNSSGAGKATLTLAAGSNLATTLDVAGSGSVIFNGTVTSIDAVGLQSQSAVVLAGAGLSYATNALAITNNGTIAASYNNSVLFKAAVALGSADTLINNGTISLVDIGDVSPSYSAVTGGGAITNSGTITAVGASAITTSYHYGNLPPATVTNSGTITSDQSAINLNGQTIIANSGTIASTGAAAINSPFYTAQVDNLTGAIISGAGDAIDLPGGIISNAGTIDGNVNLAYSQYGYSTYSTGIYVDNGGTLNGNLTLGAGGALEVALASASTSPLGGVGGTINANGAALIYAVGADATTTAAAVPSGFGVQGYLLTNPATLTFSGNTALTGTLGLAGTGAVIFNGSIATTDVSALLTQPQILLAASGAPNSAALTITNNGTISATYDTVNTLPITVLLSSSDALINNGTISVFGVSAYGGAAIVGGVAITNTGTIAASGTDGVSLGYYATGGVVALTNTGTISSDQNTVVLNGSASITNAGTISSAGQGAAAMFASNNYGVFQITNLAGGTISAAADAIDLSGGFVNNAGTINGNVNLAFSPFGYTSYASGIYSANGGTLNGNLTLNGNEALVVNLGAAANQPLGGVTGAINANGGALVYNVTADGAIVPAPVPTGFGSAAYQLSNNAVLTAPAGSDIGITLGLAGSGSVILKGAITTTDQVAVKSQTAYALTGGAAAPSALKITNNGTITTAYSPVSFSQANAVVLQSGDTLVNNGTIVLTSGVQYYTTSAAISGGSVSNAGTIIGTGANGVNIVNFDDQSTRTLTNSGTITSDQSAVLISSSANIVNSGTITGDSADHAAIATGSNQFVSIQDLQISNLAGGVIVGAVDAINTIGGTVSNAGSIIGNVTMNSPYSGYSYLPSAYVDAGGSLAGNLTLGRNGALVVDMAVTANRPLGGVTGTINANGAALFYNVASDTTITTAPVLPTGFGGVGYLLANDPTLTLASTVGLTNTLGLAGNGVVVLNGSITTTDQDALDTRAPVATGNAATTGALVITNNGSIAATDTGHSFLDGVVGVSLGASDTLINTGTITATDASGFTNAYLAAVDGGTVTNSGTISGARRSGLSLGSFAGSLTSGLTNSGTITSDQYAVIVDGTAVITNRGTIASTGTTAIVSPYYNSGSLAQISNLATGVISGVGDAIDLGGGTVSNAGSIIGNVNLAFSSNPITGPSAYFAAGGTLTGDLTLGHGEALVVDLAAVGPFAGVSGKINANGATLVYTVGSSATTTALLPTGYSALGYQLSKAATLTLAPATALTTTLGLAGSGTVVFGGTIVTSDAPAIISQPVLTVAGLSIAPNTLNITNGGTIASTGAAAILNLAPGAAHITNLAAGTISSDGDAIAVTGGIVGNAGTIKGNVDLAYSATSAASTSFGSYFADGGTISGNLKLGPAGSLVLDLASVGTGPFAGVGGTITANGAALVYNVGASATTTATLPAGYGNLTYQLADTATLTLTKASALTTSLGLAGSGTVLFNGTIATTDAPAIISQPGLTATGLSAAANALAITNNGAISVTATSRDAMPQAIALGSHDSLVNAGTITFSSAGISPTSGAITGGQALTNSGTIASTGAPAILNLASTRITNLAGGTISGNGDAIDVAGGTVSNAGAITGNVNLGYNATSAANGNPAIYIADGGTIAGNLTFSSTSGGNELIETGSGYGVTGAINGGSGGNLIVHLRSANAVVGLSSALPSGFGQQLVVASGPATQVTIQGPASYSADILVAGDGAIINQANTTGIVSRTHGLPQYGNLQLISPANQSGIVGNDPATAPLVIIMLGNYANLPLTSFTNQANIGGVDLATASFVNSGVVSGDIDLFGSGVSVLDTAAGSITGRITLHRGEETTVANSIAIAGRFAGNIDGGSDPTSLAVSGGSAAAPIAFGNVQNITGYTQTGGVAVVGGTATLGSATIAGGMFAGLIGSTITAPLITVGAGGYFASGGTINGNIAVAGTIHVGASPDTMTVNGNVALATGSTSVFEVSRGPSSKLVVSGMVGIASGTTLQVAQLQTIMPGTTLNLISAGGGITGDFTSLVGINGQIIEQGGALSVLALFDTAKPQNLQVQRSIAYVNAALAADTAPAALFTAVSALTAPDGEPIPQEFARLTPEPYASATQIGVENGLTLSRSARQIDGQAGLHSGAVFSFGQALGSWRGLSGNPARGTSAANSNGYGFMGGLGISRGSALLAAFGGYLDQTQTIAPLAASTHAKGFVAGLTGQIDSGPLRLAVAALYDDAHADTRRAAPGGTLVSAGYDLHSWSLDGQASTRLALGSDWALRPHVGATWIWTRRGSAQEADSAFALTVASAHHTAGFVDGGLRFETAEQATSRFSRFLDLGLRWQLQGRAVSALAGFADQPETLLATGVRRRAASALVSAGGTYRLTPAVSLFLSGTGELTTGGSSSNVTGGIRIGF